VLAAAAGLPSTGQTVTGAAAPPPAGQSAAPPAGQEAPLPYQAQMFEQD